MTAPPAAAAGTAAVVALLVRVLITICSPAVRPDVISVLVLSEMPTTTGICFGACVATTPCAPPRVIVEVDSAGEKAST